MVQKTEQKAAGISQGSVATPSRHGGMFSDGFIYGRPM